jgi:hypothetical protein
MSSPRHQSIHNFPNQPCHQGYYRWNNGFSSGCKPIAEDNRRLARQFQNAGSPLQADGYYGGRYDGASSQSRPREVDPNELLSRVTEAAKMGDVETIRSLVGSGGRGTLIDRAILTAAAVPNVDIIMALRRLTSLSTLKQALQTANVLPESPAKQELVEYLTETIGRSEKR